VECAQNQRNGIARVCRVIAALWGLDGSFSLSQGRERGVGVCLSRPSGEAGGSNAWRRRERRAPGGDCGWWGTDAGNGVRAVGAAGGQVAQ
jgi:hypothetical protein